MSHHCSDHLMQLFWTDEQLHQVVIQWREKQSWEVGALTISASLSHESVTHDTDLVLLLEVSNVRHVQVVIVHPGFTLSTTHATAAQAATAEVAARQ